MMTKRKMRRSIGRDPPRSEGRGAAALHHHTMILSSQHHKYVNFVWFNVENICFVSYFSFNVLLFRLLWIKYEIILLLL